MNSITRLITFPGKVDLLLSRPPSCLKTWFAKSLESRYEEIIGWKTMVHVKPLRYIVLSTN